LLGEREDDETAVGRVAVEAAEEVLVELFGKDATDRRTGEGLAGFFFLVFRG